MTIFDYIVLGVFVFMLLTLAAFVIVRYRQAAEVHITAPPSNAERLRISLALEHMDTAAAELRKVLWRDQTTPGHPIIADLFTELEELRARGRAALRRI
ncbi:MAG: hypothetical protein WAV09_02995 [Minisyncoccia bacterium]